MSKHQRDFLIAHVDGPRPFANTPLENATRESLIEREMIVYVPQCRSRLGRPDGTALTDFGHEALGMVLGWCADALTAAIQARQLHPDKEAELLRVLMDSQRAWRKNQPDDNKAYGKTGLVL